MKVYKNQKIWKVCILCYVILCLIWSLKAFVLNPVLSQVIAKDSALWYLVSDGILKNLVWTLPAVLLIRKFDDDLYIRKQELFQFPKKWQEWKEVLPVLGFVTAYCVLSSVVSHRGFYFNSGGLTECLAYVFVGITEEFVFRGFLLNATVTEKNKYSAVGINAVMFLCIHFPSWIIHGDFIANFANFGFISIILLSIFFSWNMLRFRNIWIPVITHMLWDILVTLLN